MIKYTSEELRALLRHDVTPPRAARKVIFRCRLWRPIRQRSVRRHGIPSRDGISHTVSTQPSADHVTRVKTTAFGCLNIRSLLNKFDDVVELCRDRHIDLLCLTETWHDADSAVLGRLRCAGFNVVDRPRPRAVDDLSVNHGGVAVVAAADVVLSPIVTDDQPATFESVCVRAVTGRLAAIVVVLYRPGSDAVQQMFFDELATLLDRALPTRTRST